MEETIKDLKLELRLYKQYVNIMEHLYVFDGGMPLDNKIYDQSWLTRGSRSWLNEYRELIVDHLKRLHD